MTSAEFMARVEKSPKAVLVEFIRVAIQSRFGDWGAELARARGRVRLDAARRKEEAATKAWHQALADGNYGLADKHSREIDAAGKAWMRAMDEAYPRTARPAIPCRHPMHDDDCTCGHPAIEDAS